MSCSLVEPFAIKRWFTTLAQFTRYLLPPQTSLGPSLPRLTVNQILRFELITYPLSPSIVEHIMSVFGIFSRTTFPGFWVGGWSRSGLGVSLNFWPPILLRFPRPFLFMWCDRLVKIPWSNSKTDVIGLFCWSNNEQLFSQQFWNRSSSCSFFCLLSALWGFLSPC